MCAFSQAASNPHAKRLDHLILPLQGGGIRIDGSADLTDCNIHDNRAVGTWSYSKEVGMFSTTGVSFLQ